jgi:hypothetical protein
VGLDEKERAVRKTIAGSLVKVMAAMALLVPLGVAPPAAAGPVDGAGAVVVSWVESGSYWWEMSLNLEGTFTVAGQTYGFFGPLQAYNWCCSPLGSSGSGSWYFSGWLIGADTWTGSTSAWSGSMTYSRTEIVPGTTYRLDLYLSSPASAYLPDGSTVNFNVNFTVTGTLTDGTPLDGTCGPYPGCEYDATYTQYDTPSLVDVSVTGGATSSGVSVGLNDSTAHGGLLCVSATGTCSGGAVANVCLYTTRPCG